MQPLCVAPVDFADVDASTGNVTLMQFKLLWKAGFSSSGDFSVVRREGIVADLPAILGMRPRRAIGTG